MSGAKFALNLDGTLKQRSNISERGEGQPGLYSPRASSPTATASGSTSSSTSAPSTRAAAKGTAAAPLPSPSPAVPSVGGVSGTRPRASAAGAPRKKHADPTQTVAESVAAEEAAFGISDPDIDVILAPKPRLSGASDRSSSTGGHAAASGSPPQPSAAAGESGSGAGGRRAPTGLSTLVEHQNARQQSPAAVPTSPKVRSTGAAPAAASATRSVRGTGEASAGSSSSPGAASSQKAHAAAAARTARAASRPVEPSEVTTVHVEETYVVGRTFRQYVASTSRQSINGITGNSGGGTFRQNPLQYVSAIASSGEYVAVGDRTGHVAVMKRKSLLESQQSVLEAAIEHEDERWKGIGPGAGRSRRNSEEASFSSTEPRSRDVFEFHVGQQAYTSVIDPLNSVEVTPNVTAMAFLPQSSPAAYLLTANEKVPKLYKVMTVRESATPFRAVDKIDSKTIGPLTAASRQSTVAMKPMSRYALSHEYNIHSICPVADAEQFVTADDLTMHLWCTEYPDTSIETYDIRPPYDDDPKEAIRCVRTFPHEPFLLFAVTSAGHVRVIDIRQSMNWSSQAPQLFANPPRDADGTFGNVTNSLSDCALSPCGRYIAGRDFMSVCLWDVRAAGRAQNSFPSSPMRHSAAEYGITDRWELHPSIRGNLETLYQSDLLFERFDVQFMNHRQICTGGFGNSLYTIDVTQVDDGTKAPDATSCAAPEKPTPGVRVFTLPTVEGVGSIARTPIHVKPAGAAVSPSSSLTSERAATTAGGNTLELGSRITLLSRPVMSLGGTCGMFVCCGQVVMQLSYSM